MADFRRYDDLVSELQDHVGDLASEAASGDGEAREWLLQMFPGHSRFLVLFWRPDIREREERLEREQRAQRRRAAHAKAMRRRRELRQSKAATVP